MNADPRQAILIVDDEGLIRFDLVDFFQDAGFCVFDAATAGDAITIMETHPLIRIVLTDIDMPGSMDGMKLAHYVRDRYPPTLLVIASGAVTRPLPNFPRARSLSQNRLIPASC
ncbi:response regulator [Sphingomonas sp. UYEF23]|uniref:response regulator n=1 Tax=Sphingomonas sp. UYEF23 TaxID=1756408 RepID=UPI003394F343